MDITNKNTDKNHSNQEMRTEQFRTSKTAENVQKEGYSKNSALASVGSGRTSDFAGISGIKKLYAIAYVREMRQIDCLGDQYLSEEHFN